jgi:pimeloyl-ACP methyl ester carboxylesterase
MTYADAVAAVEARQRAEEPIVSPGGSSIILAHGHATSRVVVFLHGLSNGPRQFLRLAQTLFAGGDNVYVPRLPHHAEKDTDAAALALTTVEELCALADESVRIAAGLGAEIVVAGLSAGGNIAAWIAQTQHAVRRTIIIAPALELARIPPPFAEPVMRLALRLPNITVRRRPDPSRPDRDPGFATRGIAEVRRLGLIVRGMAIQSPPAVGEIAFLLNENDRTIRNQSAMDLAQVWASSDGRVDVRCYLLPRSLGLPHDIIESNNRGERTDVVYPMVAALVRGEDPNQEGPGERHIDPNDDTAGTSSPRVIVTPLRGLTRADSTGSPGTFRNTRRGTN